MPKNINKTKKKTWRNTYCQNPTQRFVSQIRNCLTGLSFYKKKLKYFNDIQNQNLSVL